MRIRAIPRLPQPLITSPASKTPSSEARSPNGSSPSPTIRKTWIVGSTQNPATTCTLRRKRKRAHGGLGPPPPRFCCCVDIPLFLLPRLQCGGKDRAEAVRRKLGDQRRGSETPPRGVHPPPR